MKALAAETQLVLCCASPITLMASPRMPVLLRKTAAMVEQEAHSGLRSDPAPAGEGRVLASVHQLQRHRAVSA